MEKTAPKKQRGLSPAERKSLAKAADINWLKPDSVSAYGDLMASLDIERRIHFVINDNGDPPTRMIKPSVKLGNSWRRRAECSGLHTELFFPKKGEPVPEARAVCKGCAVREECLLDALETDYHHPEGVRGGKTGKERTLMMRARRKAQGRLRGHRQDSQPGFGDQPARLAS